MARQTETRAVAAKRAFGAMAAGLLVGCDAPGPPSPTTIEASDSSVFMLNGRVAKEFARGSDAPSDVGTGGAIEFNYLRGSGSDTQNLGASDRPIGFGGEQFSGAQQVRHDFTLKWYELDARARLFSRSPERVFGAEFLAGVAAPRLDFRVSSPTRQGTETLGAYGFVLGGGMLLRFREGTSAQARYTYYRGLGGNDDLAHATRTEIYLAQALARNAALRAGYVDWSLHVAKGSAINSDLNVKMRGPSLGLDILF